MKGLDDSSLFYNEAIFCIDQNDYKGAVNSIKKDIDTLRDKDDIALAYLNCGFLNDKLGDYETAIDDFTMSIFYENELGFINHRSKDVSLNGRSNSRYKYGDYKGSIEDKRKAKKIRLDEIDQFSDSYQNQIDYKNIILGTFINKIYLEQKYNILIKVSRIKKSKYDLIEDYKKVMNKERKEDVIRKLELLCESKYKIGDYKGSIKAIRRAEKYY